MARRRRSSGARNPQLFAGDAHTSLQLDAPAMRYRALLLERERLLKRIAKKKSELERVGESVRQVMSTFAARMPAIVERHRRITSEIRELFKQLLAPGALGKKARRAVLDVLGELEQSGIFLPLYESPDADFAPPWEQENSAAYPPDAEASGRGAPRTEQPPSFAEPDVAHSSAKHAGGQAGRGSVRELFRRLAVAMHPDRARDDQERERRTEAMKAVTQAYEEGDLARLLELEVLWLADGGFDPSAADAEQRLSSLERTIAELRRQLGALGREIRELRRVSPGQDLEHIAEELGLREATPLDALLSESERQLDHLEQMRDFIRAFGERRISLAEFLAGPARPDEDESLDEIVGQEVDALMQELLEQLEPRSRPTARRRPNRGRANKTRTTIPF